MSVTRRAVPRRAVPSAKTFTPEQFVDLNVKISELYPYIVKLVLLNYRNEPRFWIPVSQPQPEISSSSRGHARRASSSTNLTGMSTLTELSNSKVTLPKGICDLLDSKLKEIAFNKSQYANDDVARRIFLSFYASFNDETKREITKSRRVEDLLMKFISVSQKELKKTIDSGIRVNNNSDHYIGLFCQLLVQILNSNGYNSSHGSLISLLERYKVSLSQNTTLRPNGSANNSINSDSNRNNSVYDAPVYPTPSFEIKDISIASIIMSIFGKNESDMISTIQTYKSEATLETAVAEIKGAQENLKNNYSFAYQRSDFDSTSAYESWQIKELQELNQMLEKFQSKQPSLSRIPAAYPEQIGNHLSYKLTPPDPRSYYRLLVDLCFKRDRYITKNTLILSMESQDLLTKAAAFWRISPTTRARIILFVSCMNYQDNFFTLDNLCKEAFPLTEKMESSLMDDWTKYDKDFSYFTMQQLQCKIADVIIDKLNFIYDTPKPNINFLLKFIDNFIIPNADFDGYPPLNIMPEQIQKAENQVKEIAEIKYIEEIDKVPRDKTFAYYHLTQVADVIISRAKLLQKSYKTPLFGKINISKVATTTTLDFFLDDAKPMISHIFNLQEEGEQILAFQDLMSLYSKMVEIRYLYQQLKANTTFPFDFEAKFEPYIFQHVESSADVLAQWVKQNFDKDKFKPMDASNGVLISSSVLDVFSSFNGAVKFVTDIKWNNEIQLAKFYTRIIKGVSSGVVLYAELVYTSFQKDLVTDNDALIKQQYRTRQEQWLAKARNAVNGTVEIKPFDFKEETCIKLNNIERSIKELDGIEAAVDSERQAALLARFNRQEPASRNFFFSIKISQATGLKPCDTNGLSDPYVTLIMDQKQIAKTRTIYEDLNPVWNETFEFTTSHRKDLILTVWDENAITDHSLCGRASISLDPSGFNDFEPQEIWVNLKPQGQILLSISMESERDDIRFYFGKSYRKLMRVETDMIREIVAKFQSFIKYTLSLERLRGLSNPRFTIDSVTSIWKGKQKPKPANSKEAVLNALDPLYTFLNNNFEVLAVNLTPSLKTKVIIQTWEVILETLDLLLLPSLSDKRTSQTALNQTEKYNLLLWSDELLKFFNHDGNGNGIPIELLKTRKRQEFMAAATNFYDWSTADLKSECEKRSSQSYQNLRSLRLGPEIIRRNTVMAHRNRRALQEAQARFSEVESQSTGTENIILRILRLRGEYDFVARRLQQISSMSRSLATERNMNGSMGMR